MKYYTFWSILDAPTNSLKVDNVLLFFFIFFLIAWIVIKKFKKNKGDYEKLLLLWLTGFCAAMMLTMFVYVKFFTVDNTEERINKLLNSSLVAKVEGKITSFSQKVEHKKYGSVTTECFQVDSVRFCYADYLLGKFNSFSKTNSDVLHNGVNVRITYFKGDFNNIQKIEIGR